MEFPPVTSKIIQEKMKTTPFVIKEQIGDSVRKKVSGPSCSDENNT
jgi:hypothetical protein